MEQLVSIIVLNYRRPEALAAVLESARRQDYPNLELIVVDNGSGDEITAGIREQFPYVKLVALGENIGTAARNKGIEVARGNVLVMLDNDVSLDGNDAIQLIVRALARHPRAGCVVFRVYHPKTNHLHLRDWCHPRDWRDSEYEEFESHYLSEGAVAFRREVFDRIEPYWAPLFIGHEGFDLAVRMLNAGYEIWYAPEVKVWHAASLETRQNWRPFYYYARNLFATVYRTYPLRSMLPYVVPRMLVLGFYAIGSHAFLRYLQGLVDGLLMVWKHRAARRPVSAETIARIARLKRKQPGWIVRFRLAHERTTPLARQQ